MSSRQEALKPLFVPSSRCTVAWCVCDNTDSVTNTDYMTANTRELQIRGPRSWWPGCGTRDPEQSLPTQAIQCEFESRPTRASDFFSYPLSSRVEGHCYIRVAWQRILVLNTMMRAFVGFVNSRHRNCRQILVVGTVACQT